MTTDPPKPRRWFQFRLRTLLVVILVLSLPLSWLAVRMERARRQREAVEAIERLGGNAVYDWQRRGVRQKPASSWLRRPLGDDFFDEVAFVKIDHVQVRDTELKCLEELRDLPCLHLVDTPTTNAGPSTWTSLWTATGGPCRKHTPCRSFLPARSDE